MSKQIAPGYHQWLVYCNKRLIASFHTMFAAAAFVSERAARFDGDYQIVSNCA